MGALYAYQNLPAKTGPRGCTVGPWAAPLLYNPVIYGPFQRQLPSTSTFKRAHESELSITYRIASPSRASSTRNAAPAQRQATVQSIYITVTVIWFPFYAQAACACTARSASSDAASCCEMRYKEFMCVYGYMYILYMRPFVGTLRVPVVSHLNIMHEDDLGSEAC